MPFSRKAEHGTLPQLRKEFALMVRILIAALILVVPMFAGCGGSGLVCANNLDGSSLGFTIVIPTPFTCSTLPSFSLAFVKAALSYESPDGRTMTVFVLAPIERTNGGDQDLPGEGESLGEYVGSQGISFGLTKSINDSGETSYGGTTSLNSGDILVVIITAAADDVALLDTLKSVLDSIQKL